MIRNAAQRAAQWFIGTVQAHPMTMSVVTVSGFTLFGLLSWNALDGRKRGGRRLQVAPYTDDDKLQQPPDEFDTLSARQQQQAKRQPMSLEEARLRAMIQNAQESSWQENLQNAVDAHQNFMLPGREHEHPEFMNKIDQRSKQILKQDREQLDREKKRRDTVTQVW